MRSHSEKIAIAKDVHLFEKNGFVALLHSLNLIKVYGKKELLDIFKYLLSPRDEVDVMRRFPSKLVELLTANYIIVGEGYNREKLLSKIRGGVGKFDIKNLVLLVSNDCNFKCSYCQIEENMKPVDMVNMSKEVAGKALELFKRNSFPSAKKTVTITGGEPLMNLNVVNFMIEKVRKEFENTRIVIFTNGSLVTKELAKYFKKNDVLTLISLDGPKDMHNLVRKTKAGRGSFDLAMRGYRLLKEAGCNIGISAVGGTHNIKEVDKTFRFFLDLEPSSIGFNFSHFLLNKNNPTQIPIVKFGKILIDFYQILRGKKIFLENISRPISAFVSNKPKINECQAQGYGLTVDARGKVGPCKSLVISDIFSEKMDKIPSIEKNAMFKDWATRTPLAVSDCEGCPAIAICGGGCAYDSYVANMGDFKKIDKRICEYKKYVLEYLIWDLFEKIRDKVTANGLYIPSIEEQKRAFYGYYDADNELQRSVGHEHDKIRSPYRRTGCRALTKR